MLYAYLICTSTGIPEWLTLPPVEVLKISMLPPIVWETSGEISMLIKLEDSIVLLPFVSPCQVYPSYSGSQLFIRVVYCAGILLCGLCYPILPMWVCLLCLCLNNLLVLLNSTMTQWFPNCFYPWTPSPIFAVFCPSR